MSKARLTIGRIQLKGIGESAEVLLDIIEDDEALVERATAWATVRGYTRLVPTLERALAAPLNPDGWSALIDKPHSLIVLATWS